MGSKQGILPAIWDAVEPLPFTTVLDAFSGSGCVSHMFKRKGKTVIANDFSKYSYHMVNALVANAHETLTESDISILLAPNDQRQNFIQETFQGLYCADEDNLFLDNSIFALFNCLLHLVLKDQLQTQDVAEKVQFS
ncbi:MAG: DNA adenine methylase [Ktedonobacteraceae bacterium]